MGCGCSQARDNTFAGRRLKAERELRLNADGLYDLAAAPEGCVDGYHGFFPTATVYVVGRGTEHERIFRKGDWDEAHRHATQHDLPLIHVMAKNLCHDAVAPVLEPQTQ